jgi:hypothetical protein
MDESWYFILGRGSILVLGVWMRIKSTAHIVTSLVLFA